MGQVEIKDGQAPYGFSMRHRRDAENPDDVILTVAVRIPGAATATPRASSAKSSSSSKRPRKTADAPHADLKPAAAGKKKKERSEEQKRKDAERRKARREQQKAAKLEETGTPAAASTDAAATQAPLVVPSDESGELMGVDGAENPFI